MECGANVKTRDARRAALPLSPWGRAARDRAWTAGNSEIRGTARWKRAAGRWRGPTRGVVVGTTSIHPRGGDRIRGRSAVWICREGCLWRRSRRSTHGAGLSGSSGEGWAGAVGGVGAQSFAGAQSGLGGELGVGLSASAGALDPASSRLVVRQPLGTSPAGGVAAAGGFRSGGAVAVAVSGCRAARRDQSLRCRDLDASFRPGGGMGAQPRDRDRWTLRVRGAGGEALVDGAAG